jgi:putative addiction module component (TIGR02574 family)
MLGMNARSRALLEELRSLPPEEQDAVVVELYESTNAGAVDESDGAYLAELERRTLASKAGQTTSISHEEMRTQVHEALRALR